MNEKQFFRYLPVSDVEMDFGAYITGCGRGTVYPGENYPSSSHPNLYDFSWERGRILPEFGVVYISEGTGVFETKITGRIRVVPGMLFIIFPNIWHRYRPDPATGWTEHWFHLSGMTIHELAEKKFIVPENPCYKVNNTNFFLGRFDQILSEIYNSSNSENSIFWGIEALALLGELSRSTCSTKRLATNVFSKEKLQLAPLVVQVLEIIWTQSHRIVDVSDIARQLNVNRRTLERKFFNARRRTILQEITQCRISRAKRLLIETSLPIKSICNLSGFSSPNRMYSVFRLNGETSPAKLRHKQK